MQAYEVLPGSNIIFGDEHLAMYELRMIDNSDDGGEGSPTSESAATGGSAEGRPTSESAATGGSAEGST
jgi:hypothetical protein